MPIRSAAARTVKSDISRTTSKNRLESYREPGSERADFGSGGEASAGRLRHGEAIGLQDPHAVGFLQIVDELSRERLPPRRSEDDGSLLDGRMRGLRDLDVGAGALERRRQGQCERQQPDVGAPGLRKLR